MHEGTGHQRRDSLEHLGAIMLRVALVVALLWVGGLKFTAYEAEGVHMLAGNNPFLGWGFKMFGPQGFAEVLGVIEIILGLMIATRSFAPKVSSIGSMGVIVMSLLTLSILFTNPMVIQKGFSFPLLSPMPGQFLLKDFLLLAAAIWTAGEARAATRVRS
ncbi:MAG: DUF417 family protein [Gemmatimonadaceae bacterium]